MKELHITSLQNAQVKMWRALKDSKGRAAHRLFLAEGDHMAGEALKENFVKTLLVDETAVERYAMHIAAAREKDVDLCLMPEHVLASVCDARTPQGIVAVCALPETKKAMNGSEKLLAALDGVQDPGNVGTILRTLDAAGFDAMLINNKTADPYAPKSVRASMSGLFFTQLCRGTRAEILSALKGTPVIVADMDGENVFTFTSPKDFTLVIGNEANGISNETQSIATHTVKIPMRETQESLFPASSLKMETQLLHPAETFTFTTAISFSRVMKRQNPSTRLSPFTTVAAS